MKIEIPDLLESNGFIKKEYTRDGSDTPPSIKWSDAPNGTLSFALYVHDPDAPMDWAHWIIINIPKEVKSIPYEGVIPGEEVINDFGAKSYGGPSPPSGTHRYYFIIYALSVSKLDNVNKNNFLEKIGKVKLAEASIMGKYSRS
jgi:Raf kinase inhibitor-like YbhB/YbcL family protein